MKTLFVACVVAASTSASAQQHQDLTKVFAGCVGRLSAELEHAWLFSDPLAEAHAHQRLVFLSLLEATMPSNSARAVLNFRIEVKMAHAALLTQAAFGTDRMRADAAKGAAQAHLSACQMLLLDT